MKQHELRQLIREEISKIINEKEALTPDEQKIVDDILSSINEGMFDDMLEKVKSYARKGLMTVAILASLLSSPNLTQAQKQNIKNAAQTEMSSSTSKGDAIQSLNAGLKSTNPFVINSKDFNTNNPFTSWNYGINGKNRKATVGLSIKVDKGSSDILIVIDKATNQEESTEYDMIVSLAKSFGFKGETSLSGGLTTFNISKDKVSDVISFMKKSAPILQKTPSKTFNNNFGGIGNYGPAQPGPALNEAFLKMQKLAGIKLNENDEIDYDDDDDFIDLNLSFQESPDYHSYDEVLDIIKSYEDKDILEDFKSTFLENEKVYKENYSDFLNDYIADMSEKEYIKANWISITDPDIYDKAGLV